MAKDTTVLGKAFEYACLLAIYNALKDNQPIAIETSPQFDTAKSFYNSLKEGKQLDLCHRQFLLVLWRANGR